MIIQHVNLILCCESWIAYPIAYFVCSNHFYFDRNPEKHYSVNCPLSKKQYKTDQDLKKHQILRTDNYCKYSFQNHSDSNKLLYLSPALPYFKSQPALSHGLPCSCTLCAWSGVAYPAQYPVTHPNCSLTMNTKRNAKALTV